MIALLLIIPMIVEILNACFKTTKFSIGEQNFNKTTFHDQHHSSKIIKFSVNNRKGLNKGDDDGHQFLHHQQILMPDPSLDIISLSTKKRYKRNDFQKIKA